MTVHNIKLRRVYAFGFGVIVGLFEFIKPMLMFRLKTSISVNTKAYAIHRHNYLFTTIKDSYNSNLVKEINNG